MATKSPLTSPAEPAEAGEGTEASESMAEQVVSSAEKQTETPHKIATLIRGLVAVAVVFGASEAMAGTPRSDLPTCAKAGQIAKKHPSAKAIENWAKEICRCTGGKKPGPWAIKVKKGLSQEKYNARCGEDVLKATPPTAEAPPATIEHTEPQKPEKPTPTKTKGKKKGKRKKKKKDQQETEPQETPEEQGETNPLNYLWLLLAAIAVTGTADRLARILNDFAKHGVRQVQELNQAWAAELEDEDEDEYEPKEPANGAFPVIGPVRAILKNRELYAQELELNEEYNRRSDEDNN